MSEARLAAIDAALDWFDERSRAWVLLSPDPLPEIIDDVHRFRRAVLEHLGTERRPRADDDGERRADPLDRRIEEDHRHFRDSLDELAGLLSVVVRDDHGGHRQALGQYGRILVESFRRHRRDEAAVERRDRTAVARQP